MQGFILIIMVYSQRYLNTNEPEAELACRLITGLRRFGAPAHRAEDALRAFTATLDLPIQFHVLPGAVLVSATGTSKFLEQEPGLPDLNRLTDLYEITDAVTAGSMNATEALEALDDLEAQPDPLSLSLRITAFGTASASAVGFFGGGAHDVLASGLLGALAGSVALLLPRLPGASRLLFTAAGFVSAVGLGALGTVWPLSAQTVLVTSLIVLLPGFSLTVALTELATRHRLCGTTGLATSALTLLELGFGVALGTRVSEWLWGPANTGASIPLPMGWEWLAIGVVAISFGALLEARPSHLWHILGACLLALHASRLGQTLLGPELGAGLAALMITIAGNSVSRLSGTPALVWQMPGVLLLVPGAIGFTAVQALMEQDAIGGVQSAFAALLSATALVAGFLLGGALVPPKRVL